MLQAMMVMGSIVAGAGVIVAVIVWLNRLSGCDPFDPSEQC